MSSKRIFGGLLLVIIGAPCVFFGVVALGAPPAEFPGALSDLLSFAWRLMPIGIIAFGLFLMTIGISGANHIRKVPIFGVVCGFVAGFSFSANLALVIIKGLIDKEPIDVGFFIIAGLALGSGFLMEACRTRLLGAKNRFDVDKILASDKEFTICKSCEGTGNCGVFEKEKCPECKGHGYLRIN